jgi:hypothetical protein
MVVISIGSQPLESLIHFELLEKLNNYPNHRNSCILFFQMMEVNTPIAVLFSNTVMRNTVTPV